MRAYLLILFVLCSSWSFAQRSFDYGISFGGNVISRISDAGDIGTMPGGFGGVFYNWGSPSPDWSIQAALQFQHGLFQLPDPNLKGTIQMVNLRILPQYHSSSIEPFSFYTGVEIGKHLVTQRDLNLNRTGDPISVLSSWNYVRLGFTGGISMALNPSTSFRMDFTSYPVAGFQQTKAYLPAALNFGLQLNFNQILIDNKTKKQMVYNLRALNDPTRSTDDMANDTLYILNYACSDSMTDQVLDSLFGIHYTFSNHRLIQQADISEVKEKLKPRFFAIVGDLYGSMNSPAGAGIFLLNKDFELTEFPYPVQTDYFSTDLIGECFGDLELSAMVIRQFDKRLFSRSQQGE